MDVLNYSWIESISLPDPQRRHVDIESRKNFVIPLSIAEIIAILLSLFVTQSVISTFLITVGFEFFQLSILNNIISIWNQEKISLSPSP